MGCCCSCCCDCCCGSNRKAPLKLGYWNIRGLAQPIRLLLEHAGAEYEDIRYGYGPAPEYPGDEWFNVKFELGLDFPNCPYIIDGDVKLTQSVACLRYVGSKYGIVPKSQMEQARADLLEQQIVDWKSIQYDLFYGSDYDKLKEDYKNGLSDKVEQLSKFLGDRRWMAGDKITYIDFFAYDWLDVNRLFCPGLLDTHSNIQEYVKRVEELPNISKYIESDKFIKTAINGPMAAWGGGDITIHPRAPVSTTKVTTKEIEEKIFV